MTEQAFNHPLNCMTRPVYLTFIWRPGNSPSTVTKCMVGFLALLFGATQYPYCLIPPFLLMRAAAESQNIEHISRTFPQFI